VVKEEAGKEKASCGTSLIKNRLDTFLIEETSKKETQKQYQSQVYCQLFVNH
jgi:hypothetical protein